MKVSKIRQATTQSMAVWYVAVSPSLSGEVQVADFQAGNSNAVLVQRFTIMTRHCDCRSTERPPSDCRCFSSVSCSSPAFRACPSCPVSHCIKAMVRLSIHLNAHEIVGIYHNFLVLRASRSWEDNTAEGCNNIASRRWKFPLGQKQRSISQSWMVQT